MIKMEPLIKRIESIAPGNGKDLKLFSSKFEEVHFKKKEVIFKKGDVEDYVSFVNKGMVRLYIPKKENDITINILFENQFVKEYVFKTRNTNTI